MGKIKYSIPSTTQQILTNVDQTRISGIAPLVTFDENGDIPISPYYSYCDNLIKDAKYNNDSFSVIQPLTSSSTTNNFLNKKHQRFYYRFRNRLFRSYPQQYINNRSNQILKPPQKYRTPRERLQYYLHLLTKFIFSQIGLTILVVLYVGFGGLIFYLIESRHEHVKHRRIELNYNSTIDRIRRIAGEEFNWSLNKTFELNYALWRGMLWRNDGNDEVGWKVKIFHEKFYLRIDAELKFMFHEQEKLMDKNENNRELQKWTYSTAMLYAATVITTVGYGNIAPKSIAGKILTCGYAMIGIPIMIMCLTNTGDLLAYFFIKYYSYTIRKLHRTMRKFRSKKENKFEQECDGDDDEEQQQHVPIAATLGVLGLYILAGALLFSHWEGWSYIDGAYFSFITFTTIGLGDLVPGKSTFTGNKNGKSILCALYLLFGMTLTAMSFKLMQDDLFSIKRKLFKKLGIIDSDDEEEEESNNEKSGGGFFASRKTFNK
ncbi:unnamed protein product [Didymodactylos carnosus]|uniref:Potassium channel domain-containing protein n=1 Tax=Didymodactylos carnosus TaxID=1234261 RepID=A0A815GFH8_9BILA|nr:unnamed protein product [Didymodactylos carnosus]CAF1338959.1 unnamed protein product [Didymodactylos carnosus]CAF3937157.1 unnamed protein product [Didymodactylos carnosus]CAF4198196.1 unnamed protein product [Didymodactylos carnosus]